MITMRLQYRDRPTPTYRAQCIALAATVLLIACKTNPNRTLSAPSEAVGDTRYAFSLGGGKCGLGQRTAAKEGRVSPLEAIALNPDGHASPCYAVVRSVDNQTSAVSTWVPAPPTDAQSEGWAQLQAVTDARNGRDDWVDRLTEWPYSKARRSLELHTNVGREGAPPAAVLSYQFSATSDGFQNGVLDWRNPYYLVVRVVELHQDGTTTPIVYGEEAELDSDDAARIYYSSGSDPHYCMTDNGGKFRVFLFELKPPPSEGNPLSNPDVDPDSPWPMQPMKDKSWGDQIYGSSGST